MDAHGLLMIENICLVHTMNVIAAPTGQMAPGAVRPAGLQASPLHTVLRCGSSFALRSKYHMQRPMLTTTTNNSAGQAQFVESAEAVGG